ncbi:TPA: hypothetical protein ACNU17_002188 [Aeromonas salmonicida subsp. pectinolytica]
MSIKTGVIMTCALAVGSFSAFAQAPVPYNVRAGHNIIYMDWSVNALSTDSVSVSTLDDTKLGTVAAVPGKTKQLQLPMDKSINTVKISYNGDVHVIALQHGMGNGRNR